MANGDVPLTGVDEYDDLAGEAFTCTALVFSPLWVGLLLTAVEGGCPRSSLQVAIAHNP